LAADRDPREICALQRLDRLAQASCVSPRHQTVVLYDLALCVVSDGILPWQRETFVCVQHDIEAETRQSEK